MRSMSRALDVETVRKLERVAAQWKLSKSEVLRRAIDLVAREPPATVSSRLQALDELQKTLKLTPKQAGNWEREVRHEWVKSSARHVSHTGARFWLVGGGRVATVVNRGHRGGH
jgi:hypothetical protein